jgi:hypothetical protein
LQIDAVAELLQAFDGLPPDNLAAKLAKVGGTQILVLRVSRDQVKASDK